MITYNSTRNEKTFYFHDYETFGINSMLSQASQFAGIRTDENLNIIDGSELNIYCSDRDDQLPSPMACLVTRITPQHIQRQDPSVVFNEYEFTKIIKDEMTQPNTCNIGYNSVAFDDEWSRNLMYRNYFNPYDREWKNGCSRADGLFIVMMAYIYNPNLLNFPLAKDEDGNHLLDNNGKPMPSFKLEELSKANGIIHENAHDALSDVIALIGVLKIIKDKDPRFFDYVLSLKDKKVVSEYLTEYRKTLKPFLHVSSFYGKVNNSCSVVVHLGNDVKNKNMVYVFDLSCDPSFLLNKSPDEIRENIFSKKDQLEEAGQERYGIKTIAINKLPMFLELDQIKHRADAIGLASRSNLFKENLFKLKDIMSKVNVTEKLREVFSVDYNQETNPDKAIYAGFATNDDNRSMDFIHSHIENGTITDFRPQFQIKKFNHLFNRFMGRNFKDQMSDEMIQEWYAFCRDKLLNGEAEYTFEMYEEEIQLLMEEHKDNKKYIQLLNELIEYGKNKKALLNI